MAMQSLDLGTANAGDGDALRSGGEKINANFTELYTVVGNLATVAMSGSYSDLSGRPTLGTAAGQDSDAFATAAQGTKADAAAAGPASATDNAVARFDAATGKILQNSGVVIDDNNNVTGAASITVGTAGAGGSSALKVAGGIHGGQSGGGYARLGYNIRFTGTANSYQYDVSDVSVAIEYGKANGSFGGLQIYTAPPGTSGDAVTFTAGPYVSSGGTSWTTPSDARLKDNVQPITVLDRTAAFRAVTFDWKQSGKRDCGVIAQEVQSIFPEVVNEEGDFLGVDYGKLAALAMQAVKELAAKVAELEAKIG
ncbi:tail fiber domain-containing protein [Nitrobacteraceae bacterium UC4446_H13]